MLLSGQKVSWGQGIMCKQIKHQDGLGGEMYARARGPPDKGILVCWKTTLHSSYLDQNVDDM